MEKLPLKPLLFEKAEKKLRRARLFPKAPPPVCVLFFILAFLCGRTELFGSLHPFGGALFAAAFSGAAGLLYAASAILGMLSSGARAAQIGQYIFAACLYALAFEKFRLKKNDGILLRSVCYTAALFLAGAFFTASKAESVLLYDIILLLIELAAAFVSCAAFSAALPTVKQMRLSYRFSAAEEMSVVFLFGTALCGAKDISQIGPINISSILCILTVLVFSVRLGAARGAVAGLTMGLVSSLGSGGIDISCVSYASSALAAGFCGVYGAIPACSAFILANALVTALANGSTEILINIYDIFAACILYSAIPEKVLSHITAFGARDEAERAVTDANGYGEYVLKTAAGVLSRLSKRLDELDRRRADNTSGEVRFFERVARRSCSGCGMRRLCWSRDVKNTCDSLRKMLENYSETGEADETLLPKNCLRPKDLTSAFLQMNEIYRSDLIWRGKLSELRTASRGQLRAFEEIILASKKKLSAGKSFDRTLADDIARRLAENNIAASGVIALRDSELDPTVTLTLGGCGSFSLCDNAAEKIISEACGRKMLRAGRRDCASCKITYVAAPPFPVSFATCALPRTGKKVSGDTALFRVIDKSLSAAVLCDGCGSGENAAAESAAAAETILDLIELGIEGEKAMEIVNSVFLPFGEVTYSAADLFLCDGSNGRVKIIKCGGAAAFSKSGGRVDAMYSKSMPLGAAAAKDVESFSFPTGRGDMIVMITDGVNSCESGAKDGWLITEMEKFHGDDPHGLCDAILEKALKKCSGSPRDDLTVLAAHIE